MIFILEGPDGAGKSTLAKYLAGTYDAEIIHMSYPKTEKEKNNMFNAYKELLTDKTNLVIDRAWYSEMVYGPILRGKSYISLDQMEQLEELIKNNSMIYYCTDSIENLWDRCTERGESYITSKELLQEISEAYDQLMYQVDHKMRIYFYIIEPGVFLDEKLH